ncbi:hypothetical protein TNCT_238561 [Trichonephila clavata]|uniref:Uncharacterized protein n=1 Tax=Trichonephila clavata TaxID=2740835 RepID=A0A8X6FQ22_TRICU|nr:hypothetical protein TNCT_238561 [Trichonephila clavata]
MTSWDIPKIFLSFYINRKRGENRAITHLQTSLESAMTFSKTQIYFILLLCALWLQLILAAPTRGPNREPQAKMLRAHMIEGSQPRFEEYPLLYAMGFQRQ